MQALRHGYTLHDIDHLARAGVHLAFARAMDYTDRYEAAWHTIAESLYTAETPPTRRDLRLIGARAVDRLVQDQRRTWGVAREWGSSEGGVAAFQRYWELSRRVSPSPEDTVVDRQALREIWPCLSATHQQVLLAMAAHADQALAAEAVGKSYATFGSHLRNARRAFFVLWHEHETPSRLWGKADHRHGRRTAVQVLINRRQQRARRQGSTNRNGDSAA